MKISKQLFSSEMKKPEDFQNMKTSSLLENGTFTFFRDPGIPFYLPLGKRVLDNLQSILLDESEKMGISQIEIPAIMKDEVLEEGEEIVDTFRERIIKLSNHSLEGYHLLTTPEPMLLDLANIALNSHNQLPVRAVYDVDVFRGVQRPKGMLKGRQFRTFMGNSLDKDSKSLNESLELFGKLSENIFKRLDIEVYERRNQGGIDIEHFYFGSEGDNLMMPEIDQKKRVNALSLSMAYHYNPEKKIKAKFRNRQNKNSRLLYATFGLGTQRAFYVLFDAHRDEKGFNLPLELAPFTYSVIPLSKKNNEEAEKLYAELGRGAMLDDRKNIILGDRASFSDYVGVPWKVIIGNGKYTLRNRSGSVEKSFDKRESLSNYLRNGNSKEIIPNYLNDTSISMIRTPLSQQN